MDIYINVLIKTFVLYFFLIFVLRTMGKREIGELSLFDVAVIFIISEILSISISDPNKSILLSIIPIVVIVLLEIIISKICYKNEKIRDIIYGKAEILIINGKIDVNVMKKDRYNLDDLISHLHANNIASPLEVKFAILEANGKLTVFKKDSKILWPEPIIKDGKLIKTVVNKLNINLDKFNNELFKRGFSDYKEILICYLLENDLYIQKKMLTNKK
jgi:uncharacterized membrane protein YcaP (DUF421 family)